MNITEEELNILIECEDYLYKILCEEKIAKVQAGEIDDLDDDPEYDLFCKYNTLVEMLIQRKLKIEKNSK